MTDQEIIKGLIARDNKLTEAFFFVNCRPLFGKIISLVFDYEVDYDELVLAIRFFIKKRHKMIEDSSHETLYDMQNTERLSTESNSAREDIERLFARMNNKRYVLVIQRLVLEDWEPEQLAQEMHITTANLYNIKRRAMAQLTHAALSDIKAYGK